MTYYDILKACRRIAKEKNGEILSSDLSEELDIPIGSASPYLGKMQRYGYLIRVGRKVSGRGRPSTVYKLTRWGIRFRPASGRIRLVANPKK